jgi:hypothetical protein
MSWYDDKGDFWNLIGDPGGYVSGQNKNGFGGIKNMLMGDPEAAKKAYDQAIQLSQQGGSDIKNFLLGQQGKAQQYYAPLQHMYQGAYGTEGVQAPQIPQASAAGMGPLSRAYGGK